MKRKLIALANPGTSLQCCSMTPKATAIKYSNAIIIVGADDDEAMKAAKRYLLETENDLPILVMKPEIASQIKLIQRYGRNPAMVIENGEIKVRIAPKHVNDSIGGLTDAMKRLSEVQKELVAVKYESGMSNQIPNVPSPIHPKFGAKYQPKANWPNKNKPRRNPKKRR